MTHLDDVLSRHDILTVQALALTAMYSFRAEVSFVLILDTGITIDRIRMGRLSGEFSSQP